MGIFPIGGQRVGVERSTVTGYTDYGEPITETAVVWVDQASFQIQTPSEEQNMTVTTSEIAWAFLPVVDGAVPAVDDANAAAPIAIFDSEGKLSISSGLRLIHNGLSYVMRGDAVLEQDIRGRQDHVFCLCERQQG